MSDIDVISFGAGNAVLTPLSSATATPIFLPAMQELSLDYKYDSKQLHGQGVFPIDVARGKASIEGKLKLGISKVELFALLTGDTVATGGTAAIIKEAGTVPADTAYTVTVANDSDWTADLGVLYTATGRPLTKVASSPGDGEYSVAAGVYTFNVAQASTPVLISYKYTETAGFSAETGQVDMGSAPEFSLTWVREHNGVKVTVELYRCRFSDKKTTGTNDDHDTPEYSFMAFANAADKVGQHSILEV